MYVSWRFMEFLSKGERGMDDRNVVDAMHRLELIRRMRIQTMLRLSLIHI